MKFEDVFPYTFRILRKKYDIPEPSKAGLIERCRSNESDLCHEMLAEPFCLSAQQMQQAAERYRLGKSRSGKTIYWMIDDRGIVRDGRIGSASHAPDTWVSTQLQHRYPEIAQHIAPPDHCLFGLHLIKEAGGVAIVEKECSAVILSELYPQSLWLATSYPANLSERLLEPLQGHSVIMFPPTDDTMDTYLAWMETADQARRKYHLDITVSSLLEDRASKAQKARSIDLLDFICENP